MDFEFDYENAPVAYFEIMADLGFKTVINNGSVTEFVYEPEFE